MNEFGDKLISLRTERGLTAKEVCMQVHIPQSRLNELEWVDRIMVLKDSRLVQTGSHQDLLQQEGHYKELYNYFSKDDQKE